MAHRILIVDDEPSICNALRRSLRKEGYELRFASEPLAALQILKETPIDLIISDQLMPNMSGIEFLDQVHTRYPDCIRMILTGHADIQMAISAINDGEIYRFLTKPWDDAELKATLFLAFKQLELERENRRLLAAVHRQRDLIAQLGRAVAGLGVVPNDLPSSPGVEPAGVEPPIGR